MSSLLHLFWQTTSSHAEATHKCNQHCYTIRTNQYYINNMINITLSKQKLYMKYVTVNFEKLSIN